LPLFVATPALPPAPPRSSLLPYTPLFPSRSAVCRAVALHEPRGPGAQARGAPPRSEVRRAGAALPCHRDRTSDFSSRGSTSRLRSEEHTSELQSRFDLVCRLLLAKTRRDA